MTLKLLDTLLGRTKPKEPDLDALFALPAAIVTLETQGGLRPTGQGAVAFKPSTGQAFSATRREIEDLLRLDAGQPGTELSESDDDYGYHWVTLRDPVFENLVTKLHMVNSTLKDRGFGPQLLCSAFGFAPTGEGRGAVLIYLYKRGTFYPFVPLEGERRDNELELRVAGMLRGELPVEEDLSRWFPVWGTPLT